MSLEAALNLLFVVGTLLTTLIFGLIKIKSLKGRLVLSIMVLLPAIIFLFGFFVPQSMFGQQTFQDFVLSFGGLGPIILILLQVVQVLIPPLDHNVTQFIGGFIFGPWLGFIYNYSGRILGSILAFMIAKRYGRPILEKVISKEEIEKYDKIWEKSLVFVFLGYVMPFFPDDAISYLAGASKVKFKIFLAMILLGHPAGVLGTTLAGSLGETLWFKSPIFWGIGLSTLSIGLIVFSNKRIREKLNLTTL